MKKESVDLILDTRTTIGPAVGAWVIAEGRGGQREGGVRGVGREVEGRR